MATANEIPAMWNLAIFGSFCILGLVGFCLLSGNGECARVREVPGCLERAGAGRCLASFGGVVSGSNLEEENESVK